MNDLQITVVQTSLHWEDRPSNLTMFDKLISGVEGSDVIVLPEMFSTGFTMKPINVAETMAGPTLAWMKSKSQEKDSVLTGSIVIQEGGKYYNRLLWVRPDGTVLQYDKRHLFSMAGEHTVYTRGTQRLVADCGQWRICPMICYDLRFPVWSRNREDYDVLIYTANWPVMRIAAWNQLLSARAIENQAFVAGVNRTGKDGNGYPYSGSSRIYDPAGHLVLDAADKQGCFTTRLSASGLSEIRRKLPFLADRDDFSIDPG